VLATQIRQKDGIFYFGSVRAPSCSPRSASSAVSTEKERKSLRAHLPGRRNRQFIAKIERTDRAFQRTLSGPRSPAQEFL